MGCWAPKATSLAARISCFPLQPHRLAGDIELNRLCVGNREETDSIARRTDHVLADSHNCVGFLAKPNMLAQRKLQRFVGDHFKMILSDWPAGNQRHPLSSIGGPTQAENRHPQRFALILSLDRVVDKLPRLPHTRNRRSPIDQDWPGHEKVRQTVPWCRAEQSRDRRRPGQSTTWHPR